MRRLLTTTEDHIARKEFFYLQCIYEATHRQPFCASPPIQVCIETSSRCNLRCTHCAHQTMERKQGNIPLELFKKVIDEVAFYQPYIDFHLHGEPLFNKHLTEMVAYTKKHNLQNRLVTNVTLLTRDMSRRLLEAGLDYICLSLSGATKKTYEAIHRNAIFEKTLGNLLDFLETERDMDRYIRTRTVFVEEEHTAHEKERYLAMLGRLPIDHVSVSPMFNFFGLNEEKNLDDQHRLPREQWPVCTIPWKWLGIGSNGEIRACMFDYEHRYVIGDAWRDNVMDAWNSEAMQAYRNALLDRDYRDIERKGPLCSECNEIWQMDEHGCTSQWPQDFGSEMEKAMSKGTRLFESDQDRLETKFQYLQEHREEWLAEMLQEVEGREMAQPLVSG